MTRVEMFPVAPATPVTAPVGGRNADDGAGFEVAIRSQLDSGRGVHARDRVDPADPRGRSTVSERSQRPTPDSVFERPDRPIQSDRTDRTDHPHHPIRPGHPGHPARFERPTRDESSAGPVHGKDPSASSSKGAGDFVARASQPSSEADHAPEPGTTTAVGTPTTGGEATVVAAGATSSATSNLSASTPGAPDGTSAVAAATQAEATAATDALPTGAGDVAAGTPAAGTTDADQVAARPEGGQSGGAQPGEAQSGGAQSGTGQGGAGQQGSGQSEGPVPTLVHGRPASLGGVASSRADAGTDTSVTGAAPTGQVTPVDAATVPVTAGVAPALAAATVTSGLTSTAAADAAAAASATAPAAPATGTTAASPAATAPAANPVVPLPPQAQVLSAVSPLLTGPDGTHRVTVHLEPENLGKVRVQLSLSGGEVALHLIAADAATRETLRQGLPELRAQLEQSGLRTAEMDVQSGPSDLFGQAGAGAGTSGGHAPRTGHGAIPHHRTTTADTALPSPSPTTRSLSHDVALDVRM
ncbi:hypothetical protein ASD62_10065 [Phycicoccus sp. Root563]|uniref:flagellar hook-length control protein FliK n=1 Tax=Phycicoccus sp. Root563 TaxID=1736562 RepID=UPI000702F311|nr:flagellar hook-length control protein FliK [Phycicoccus sp. Root563]KQZ89598.1 hypothetical protein ASD62_10065 [Phycicoccus sp. Root563]